MKQGVTAATCWSGVLNICFEISVSDQTLFASYHVNILCRIGLQAIVVPIDECLRLMAKLTTLIKYSLTASIVTMLLFKRTSALRQVYIRFGGFGCLVLDID